MSIQFASQYLLPNPSKHIVTALLLQPYALDYAYLTCAIHTRFENTPNFRSYKKTLCVFIEISLLILIVSTIMYVVLRVLCSYSYQTTEIDQVSHTSHFQNFDKTLYMQNIEKIKNEAHTAVKKIKDPLIKKDIQNFINETSKTAQQLIKTLSNIDLCYSLTENAQHELLHIKEQAQHLVNAQKEEFIFASLQPIVLSEDALNWVQEISNAVSTNDKNTFEILLERGKKSDFINIRFPRFLNGTLFHHFSKMDRAKDYLVLLISAGIDPSLQDNWGNTGLIWAIANARNTNASLILRELGPGPYLDIQCSLHQNTALHLAIAKGYKNLSEYKKTLEVSNLELVNILLDLKANPNLQTKEGYTPLHLACLRRDYAVISALLNAGAISDIKDNEGQIPKDLITIGYRQASKVLEDICSFYLLDKEEYEDKANLANIQSLL